MHHSKATLALTVRPFNIWLKGPYDGMLPIACFCLLNCIVSATGVLYRVHVNIFKILASSNLSKTQKVRPPNESYFTAA